MHLVIRKQVAQKMGFAAFEPWGISVDRWKNVYGENPSIDIEMERYAPEQIEELRILLGRYPNVRGTNVLLNDIALWQEALRQGHAELKARTVRQFETILKQYMLRAPRQHLYKRLDENAVLAYYVGKVEYHPPVRREGNNQPAYVSMELLFEEFGTLKSTGVFFYAEDCQHIPVSDALIEKGYAIENPILRAEYELHLGRYQSIHPMIGKQYLASGRGMFHEDDDSRRWGMDRQDVQLDRYGEKTRVVVDVFNESGKERNTRQNVYVNSYYWANAKSIGNRYDEDTDEDNTPIDEYSTLERIEPEVPVHPWIVVFHLGKHLRLRAHVAQLEEYIYDQQLDEKLVLPKDQKQLVELLIDTKGGAFQDIVQGKSGGAVVLLSGEPGTGKTLTAEVYAESEQRALYSVQCSQLGINPETLEKSLMVAFDRARRWNAVMLLDEADVYVHERGNSMTQNAIVGVFLRVLEYQGTILFLTTNRPDDVDDAIASRCIARLHYTAPDAVDAARIWQVLVGTSGMVMSDDTIAKVVQANPGMTGRDIKNILKLAGLMEGAETGITAEHVAYVQQFKPTGSATKVPPVEAAS